jgi:multidrug resistance efflux pump
MRSNPVRSLLSLLLLILIAAAIVYLYLASAPENGSLIASGTVETVEVMVASEVAGTAVEVLVGEGDTVQKDDSLILLDDEIIKAQRQQVLAAINSVEAALSSAEVNLEAALIQAELTRQAAQLEDLQNRIQAWEVVNPGEFSLPIWYFEKGEEIVAAEAEVIAAEEALEVERANLEEVLRTSTHADLVAAESRLADARAAFMVAEEVLDRAWRASDDEEVGDFAEDMYDAVEAELEAAQSDYEEMLSEDALEGVLEVRARVAVAQARYDIALDRLIQMQTGDYSLQVQAAEAAVRQAHTTVAQSEAALSQAQAELAVIDLQSERFILRAPISGVIATRNIEPGEVVWPGAVTLTIYRLDTLTITVFIPEDRYGKIGVGEQAIVSVDSFPDETFTATVVHIADEAEYTPRNVQTEEGRRTTVFAVELSVVDPVGKLKPGMPADVDFGE